MLIIIIYLIIQILSVKIGDVYKMKKLDIDNLKFVVEGEINPCHCKGGKKLYYGRIDIVVEEKDLVKDNYTHLRWPFKIGDFCNITVGPYKGVNGTIVSINEGCILGFFDYYVLNTRKWKKITKNEDVEDFLVTYRDELTLITPKQRIIENVHIDNSGELRHCIT